MALCRPRQLTHTRTLVTKRFPAHHQDFTRVFPRVLCLYIFSFLDPRSLCRAAQVNSSFFCYQLKSQLYYWSGLLVLEIFERIRSNLDAEMSSLRLDAQTQSFAVRNQCLETCLFV